MDTTYQQPLIPGFYPRDHQDYAPLMDAMAEIGLTSENHSIIRQGKDVLDLFLFPELNMVCARGADPNQEGLLVLNSDSRTAALVGNLVGEFVDCGDDEQGDPSELQV